MVVIKIKKKRGAEDANKPTRKSKVSKPNIEEEKPTTREDEPVSEENNLITPEDEPVAKENKLKAQENVPIVIEDEPDIKVVEKNKITKNKSKTSKAGDFDVKYFHKQLNMKPVQLVSLSQFAEVCSKSNNPVDYMTLYLEAGGNANEILSILDYQNKKNPAISTPVFIILQLLFSKVQSSLPQYFQAAEETCRYFLNSYVSTIDFTLSEKASSKQQIVTLKLLTSIVALSPELGFTVLNQLSLQPKTLVHLVKNLNGKEKDDVRVSYINFVMAFLDGNTPLIKSALDKHGLITLIIPGLVRDNSETVLMVLDTFSKNIIHNSSISKTIKIKTFNQNMILSIFNLFNWSKNSQSPTNSEDEKYGLKIAVEDAVFEFLLVLCTSHKHGIYFTDKSLGTSDLPTSQYLVKALESLEAPWNNEKAGQLIIEIVSKCHDLYRPVIRLVEQSFDPRNSEIWFKTTIFLMNLLKSLPAKHVINSMNDMNAMQITNFIRFVYLPIPILKMSLNALNTSDDAVRNQVVTLLHVMLSSIKSYLLLLGVEKNNVMSILKSKLEDFIPKHFPSTDVLITVLHSMLDNNSVPPDVDMEQSKPVFKIPLPNQSRMLINVLDLLLLYNDVLPNSLDPISTMLDSKRLFDKMESISETDKGELKLKITMFLLCADKFAFAPDKPLFKEILQSMFEVFIASDLSISQAARGVLYNILETTGIFEKSRSEIDLLLSIIHYVGLKCDQSIGKDIVSVIEKVNKHSDKYISKLITSSTEEENADGLIKHFDALIENLQYCNENTINENIVFEKSFLTHFVVGLLENLKPKSSDSFTLLTNLYVIHLLHYQDSTENMCHILENYKVDSSVKKYILSWKSKPIILNIDFIDESSVPCKLNYALLSEAKINLETIFDTENIEKINSDSVSNSETQNISCLSEKESELFSWFNMILFYVTQQGNLDLLNECKISNASQALFHVLLMTRGDSVYSTKVSRSMVGNCLSHKVLLKNFTPFKNQKHVCEQHLSNFVLGFVKFCNENNFEKAMVDSLLRPYRHKIFLSLLSQLKKAAKNKKGQTLSNLTEILSTVNLDLSDATLIIIDVLKMDVACMVSDENEASSWVYVLCHVINQFIKHSKLIPVQILQGIALLYSKIITGLDLVINIADFEESFYCYLICNPETVISIPSATFEAIFSVKHVSKFTSKIGSLLLKVNIHLLPKFYNHVIQPEILEKRELVLPLTTAAFSHYKFNSRTDIIKQIYDNYKSNILKVIEKPHKASQIYIDNSDLIVKLINSCMDKVECENFFKKIHKFDTTEIFHLDILQAIFLKAQSNGLVDVYSNNYLLSILQLANIALKRDVPQLGKLNRISSSLKQFLLVSDMKNSNIFTPVRENQIWQNFFKSALKYYMQTEMADTEENSECDSSETALFGLVSCLIRLIYPNDDADILNLFEMTSSHSEFLKIMLSNRHMEIKTHLVKLLFVMVVKNKGIMKSAHITVYLSSYHGSLNICDRYLLALLKFYERNGQSMTEYQPYLWGDTAANHYAVRSKRTKSSLWSNPTANHILNLLDREMIEKTIRYFPTHTILDVEEDLLSGVDCVYSVSKNEMAVIVDNTIEDSLKKKNGKGLTANCEKLTPLTGEMKLREYKLVFNELVKTENSFQQDASFTDSEIYDPAFLMPLLNFVVTPGSAVSCHHIVRGGVLSIPLMALSSSCPLVRGVALNILQRFYALLESEMYYRNDKVLWSQFIDTLKSSMDTALPASEIEDQVNGLMIPRLPAVGALYLARSALIMTNPLDPMFKPINNFIISKQYINFSVVPDLLDLFHNTDIQFMERRTWMLKLLRDGVKTFADVKILLKSVTFKIILDFYSSNLSDVKQKLLILEILNSCICIPKVAKILTDGYGLYAWLSCSLKNIHIDNKSLISMAITLISNLWMSLAFEPLPKVPNIVDIKYHENVIDTINSRCFKIGENLQCSLLCLLMDLLNKISGASVLDVKTYLNVLRKISKSSMNTVGKPQILTLLKECNALLNIQKITSILIWVVESSKVDLLLSSYSVLDITPQDSENKHLIVKYLHEIIFTWVS